jgi:hypothetical protein
MMFSWEKLGKLFDPADHPAGGWMREFAQSPTVLIFDAHVRLYFCSRPSPTADGQYLSYLSYIDLDRSDIRRIVNICQTHILGLGGLGTFDEFGTNPVSVIRHHDEVRVYYAGWTRCESVPFNAAIGVAVSHDQGETFTRIGDGPVLSYSPDEPFLLGLAADGKGLLIFPAGKPRSLGCNWRWPARGRERRRCGRRSPAHTETSSSSRLCAAAADSGARLDRLPRRHAEPAPSSTLKPI